MFHRETGTATLSPGIHTLVLRAELFPDRFRLKSPSGTFLQEG